MCDEKGKGNCSICKLMREMEEIDRPLSKVSKELPSHRKLNKETIQPILAATKMTVAATEIIDKVIEILINSGVKKDMIDVKAEPLKPLTIKVIGIKVFSIDLVPVENNQMGFAIEANKFITENESFLELAKKQGTLQKVG